MKPKLLDLFCGAGGAAMGYHGAGFIPYGVDNKPQPHYPFPFLLMDALEAMERLLRGEGLTFSNGETLYLEDFDAYHASPPCQGYIALKRGEPHNHLLLIDSVRVKFASTDSPYVIENVPHAKDYLVNPIKLCGTMFGLPLWKHRYFEVSPTFYPLLNTCNHKLGKLQTEYGLIDIPVYASHGGDSINGIRPSRQGIRWRPQQSKEIQLAAMGIDWGMLPRRSIHEAIPPAYTEYIGKYLIEAIK